MSKVLIGIMAVALCTAVILYCDIKREAGIESANMEEVGGEDSSSLPVSFEFGSRNAGAGVYVAYTNDPENLWYDEEWLRQIREKMVAESKAFDTVLLFSAKDKSPNVAVDGMDYPQSYDQYMVCGYWRFPTGFTKFCYGGSGKDGNWGHCEELKVE